MKKWEDYHEVLKFADPPRFTRDDMMKIIGEYLKTEDGKRTQARLNQKRVRKNIHG